VSTSSIYLGLFFLSISAGSLSICFFTLNLDNYFVLPFLFFQSHIVWFYFYLNAVTGNKISKINFYFVVVCFAISFILTLYVAFQLFTNAVVILEENLFPFQKNKDDLFISVSKISFGYKIFLSVLLFIYSWKLLKDFKKKGFINKSSGDLYNWLINMLLIFILFTISKIGILYSIRLSNNEIDSVNSYFFIFTQLLLLLISLQIFKYPLISIGIPISRRFYNPDVNAIDQTTRSYLFDSTIISQKILDWENSSKSYLNKNFNLSLFASELGMVELEIIYYLNEYKEINFQEYLNFLRISFVIIKIEQNYLKEHSITDLALDAGFLDRISLEKIFKKIINCSLQEFIEHE
jgi:AraC-like DNA-binding protein